MTERTMIRGGIAMAAIAVLLLAYTPTAAAHGGNHGTIKIHDDADVDPDMRNQPHVSCDFWVEGFNMHGPAGVLVFEAWPPTGNMTVVTPTGDSLSWNGTVEEDLDGHHFLKGPYQLPVGHYRVEAFSVTGHPGDHGHFSKTKTFWVEPCPEVVEDCPPIEMLASPNQDGSVLVNVTTQSEFTLVRQSGDADPVIIGTFQGDTLYTDPDTENGVTYTYTALIDDETCARVMVTAIPVFPTVLAAGLATILGLAAFTMVRRRS